jgi:hypothetical protein
MTVNPNEFTRFGVSLRKGLFNKLSPYSLEYENLWREQYNYCINGYSVGGRWISGALYYYVNFHTIQILNESTGRKTSGLPFLRDIEFEFFDLVERARREKKGLMMISGRRVGKSYMSSAILVHNFIFYSNSKGCVGTGDADKGRDLMYKVRDGLLGLKDTEFFMPLIKDDVDEEFQSGWREKDKYNVWIQRSTDRSIYFRNFKNRHTAANGLSTDVFVFEEVGMFPNLIMSYNSSAPCWKEGSKNFGIPILVGTGGDMESGSVDAQKMFNDPETYDLLSFEVENSNHKTAYFMPAWMALNDYKDELGNSLKEEAIQALMNRRNLLQRGHNLSALLQEIQYYPLTPDEAFLTSASNIFPVALLQDQIERVLRTPEFSPKRGYLELDGDKVVFVEDPYAREVDFPIKEGVDIKGCVCIYEEPLKLNGVIPSNLYIGGCDPYAQDASDKSKSLGSVFIYKRFFNSSYTHDIIVAEYTGRPENTDDYHEGVRRLCLYYNAKVLYENNIPGLKQYFETKKSLRLLHAQPDILKDILKDTYVDRRYGIHMTQQVKLYMLNQINNWLITPLDESKNEFRLNTIYSINLLKELISYDFNKGNFDRVISFGLCIIQDMEMFRVQTEKINKIKESEDFFREFDRKFSLTFNNKDYKNKINNLIRL